MHAILQATQSLIVELKQPATSNWPIILTGVITLFVGVVVFVVGQVIQRLFIEPIQEQRRIVGRIAHAVTYWRLFRPLSPNSAVLSDAGLRSSSPAEERRRVEGEEGVRALKQLAADLRATESLVPWYQLMGFCRAVMPRKKLRDVALNLVAWSGRMQSGNSDGCQDSAVRVATLIGIPEHATMTFAQLEHTLQVTSGSGDSARRG